MKQRKGKAFTKIVCMILCLCMLTTTLSSCGLWDAIVDVFKPDDPGTDTPGDTTPGDTTPGGDTPGGDTPGGDTPGGDTPGGDTETTYYKVSFAVAVEEYKNRVTLPQEKLYEAGTEIQYLPTPAVRDLLFMGWYYDAAMMRAVELTDTVESDLVLYAKVVDTSEDISVIEGVYYHTVYDVEPDYTFSVKAGSIEDVKNNLSIVNISSAGVPLVLDKDYNVTDNGDETFKVSVAYRAGKTYRANLSANSDLCFVVDGVALSKQVTTFNILVIKEEVSNLTLSDGLIYISQNDVTMLSDTPNGLVSLGNGGATINSGSVGYFSYDGAKLKSGDRVVIYEGDIPSERDFGTDNGAVKYLTITGVMQNNVYKFRVSDTKEILFIPDIIPVSGRTNIECEISIRVDSLDFSSDLYQQLGMNEDTKVEVGDYIAFYDGPMSAGTTVEYARITNVQRDNEYYYINYTLVSYDDVIASMDIFHTRTNTPVLSDEQVEEIRQQVYNDAMDSGFVEEAADYLVNLYVSTNGLKTMSNGATVRYTPQKRSYARSGGSGLYYEITKCEAEPDIKIGEGVLKHFEESNGIRVELVLSFEVEFTIGEDGENKIVIAAEAVFEEEVLLTLNVDGGAVWEMAWIFPYIVDYEMNANIDIGTYTGVSVIAKVYTNNGEEKEEEEEDDDSFFPDFDLDNIGKGDSYEEKAKNIGEELKKLFELNENIKEEVEGEEEEDDTGNDITEKYAEMMKEANETWIELVKVDIYEYSQNLDQFGILWFSMDVDFVISAQLYIMAGIEVETGVAKRYNFSVTLFERSVKTDVIDLEKAHFAFKFYCMGTAGLKIGFEIEMSLALLSSDVASVGISAELGVSLGIWGYFYYSYEKEAGEEPEIQKAGAMFFELGIYIEVKFKAHLFNIEKLTYNPTLYENLWPIYSVGTQENVFEFEDYEDSELVLVMQGTNSIVLPDYIFRMKYLDLKDGKYYSGTDEDDDTPSKTFDDETESRFLIEISDNRFTYNPKTNTLSTTVDVKNMDVKDSFEIKVQITYKHGALAFNQEIITREITIQVKNNADYGYIYVSLNGPSTLNAEGPGGSLTYPVRHGEAFTVDMLPAYDVVKGYKFVKWIWLQNYRDINGKLWQEGDEFVGLNSVERRTYLYLTAVWEPENVEHDVRIFKETIGGAYVYDRTETVSGLVGSRFNLYDLADPGYTVRGGGRGDLYLEYNGSSDLYIERATQTIRFLNVDGDGGMIAINAKSGSALVPPVVSSKLGYEFEGWASGVNGKEACVMPDTVPFADGVIVYTALWKPVSDVQYTVKHYVQNANDDGYELYMTEYLTGYYNQPIKASDYDSRYMYEQGYQWLYDINPGCNNTVYVALDGSTVIRVYYTRRSYAVRDGLKHYGYFRHGQVVDLSTFENIPTKKGYRLVGWDVDGDGIKDDTFIMPLEEVLMTPLWEGVDGTEYKVIHMVESAYSDNYLQAGFTYMYGVTGSTPTVESIYESKYVVQGQFEANYEKARVEVITYGSCAVMYAYYDRVEHDVVVRATDPESGELIKEVSVAIAYGKAIADRYLPALSEFDVEGYLASRYASSGYNQMPDHDIVIDVVYTAVTSTPFIVNHYKERADGTFFLYSTTTEYGRTGLALHVGYRQFRLTELDGNGSHFSISTEMLEEAYVARDGSTVYNLYYVRDKVKMSVYLYKLDANGNQLSNFADATLTEYYRYGERVIFQGYYDHYEFVKMVDADTDETYYSYYAIEKNTVAKIYVKPKSGVPYTVTHWIENVDGTGYEVSQIVSYTGTHGVTVMAEDYVKYMSGFTVDADHYESITLDETATNSLNVYYKRDVYDIKFYNPYQSTSSVTYQARYGAAFPAAPVDVTVPGYDFVRWENYTEGGTVYGNIEFRAVYTLSTNTPYKVNHYVMDLLGNYQLIVSENYTGSTNAQVKAKDHLHPDYTGGGYTLRENTIVKIAPDGSTVLDVYYDRESYRFSYHYYVGGKVVNSIGVLVMLGAETPDSIYDYIKDYPEYELEGYQMFVDGEYVDIDSVPAVMGNANVEIRVVLKAIGPEVTIVHKVMNADGETYEETRETFLAIPFEELDLTYYLLTSAKDGFTYRIPVNNQIPDALEENVYEIYYDRNTYTVEYVSSYDFERITESYLYGASIGVAPVFERPGYTHVGWDTAIPETMPARNISFTTTWQIRESVPVTILYMMTALDGSGYVEADRETVYHTPELMIYGSNYAKGIAGGIYQNAEKKVVLEDGSTEVCVYYTRNEYVVRFTYGDIAGAGEDVVFKLPYGSEITIPDFKVTGFELVGWSPEVPETVQAENITYTAKWQAASANITIYHWIEALDGTKVVGETETVGASVGSVINGSSYKKSLTGFTFDDADRNVIVLADGDTVVNVYYTRNSYKVTYTYGDKAGSEVEHTVKYDAALPAAPVFSIIGYTFIGWDSELASTMPANDLTYVAQWTASDNTAFTVEHYYQDANNDGYTKVETETKYGTTGETVNGEDYKKDLENAIFERAESKTVAADGSAVIKVYYVRTMYTLTFTYGDKVGEAAEYTLRYGQNVAYNPSFSVEGYVFAGWDNEIPVTMPGENVVINATWTAGNVQFTVEHYVQNTDNDDYILAHTDNRTGVTGTVIDGGTLATLVGNGIVLKSAESKAIEADGSTVIKIYYDRASYTVTYTYGDKSGEAVVHTVRYGATLPAAPVFSVVGCTFAGWDGELASTMPASNLIYAAIWAANTDTEFTVEHYYQNTNDDGYTMVESETQYGTTGATVNGADFKKTFTNAIFESAESKTVNADGTTVIKVYYIRTTYTLTFTYGDKVGEAVEHSVRYGAILPEAPEFSVDGYSFAGWDNEIPAAMPAENVVLNAIWIAGNVQFTVEHYYQNANDDGYTKAETETKYGTTDAIVYGEDYKKDLENAIFEKAESKTVHADGSTVIKVYYTRTIYTLTFTYGDKTGENAEYNLRYGQNVSYNPSFSVEGYVFAGWDGEIPEVMPAENVTLNATWMAGDGVKYSVEHYVQNADDDEYVLDHVDNRTGVTGTVIDGGILATLVGNGIVLKSAEAKAIAADGSTVIKIYYNRASYTVTYTYGTMAGTAVEHIVRYGATLPEAPVFDVAGYTFTGWDNELASTMPASNLTYVAVWTAKTDTGFTVEHYYQNANDDGYTVVESETKYGTTGATVNGTDFKKAFANAIFESAESKTVNADGTTVIKVYYARPTYTLTFTYGDQAGEAVEHTVRYGATLPEAPVFSVVGYTFTGWDNELAENMPANDLAYVAAWTANTDTRFTVEHYYQNANDDGYTKVESEQQEGTTGSAIHGETFAKTTVGFTYRTATDTTVAADGSTVIAIYYTRNSYTLTFTYGDQHGTSVEYSLRYGQIVSYNPSFSVDGHVFKAWDKEIPTTMPAENVVINATWTAGNVQYTIEHYVQNTDNNDYTLAHTDDRTGVTGAVIDGATLATLVGNGIVLKSAESKAIAADGSTVIKIYYDRASYTVTYTYGDQEGEAVEHTVRYGQTLPEAPEFSVVGYTFAGWDNALVSTMPASNLTYVAVWAANHDTEFTVEHYYQNANDDGYTLIDSETQNGTTASAINGAVFKRDFDEAIFKEADETVIAPDGTTVVRVYYIRTVYTLAFRYGENPDSTFDQSYTVRYGAILPEAPIFERIGYTFYTWMDEETLYVEEFAGAMPACDLVYTAVWVANEDTKFTVEHYIEQADGLGYDLVETGEGTGRTNSEIEDYWQFVTYDNGTMFIFERFNSEELTINPDGSTVLKVYYQRVRYAVTFCVVDQNGTPIDGVDPITVEFKYGQTITPPEVKVLEGYEFARYDTDYKDMPDEEIEYPIMWNCLHADVDGHTCEKCWETLQCVDNNNDGHCDYGRETMDPDDHRYVDTDNDHVCDICRGPFTDLCLDSDKNGTCDVCGEATDCDQENGIGHTDEDGNHKCDGCGVWMSYVCDYDDQTHACSSCYERFYDECYDNDKNCVCDGCYMMMNCVDENGDNVCDNCEQCIVHVDEDRNSMCEVCGQVTNCIEEGYSHYDGNYDHTCDVCDVRMPYYCGDWDEDGVCDECRHPSPCETEEGLKAHADENNDHYCDTCLVWLAYVCVEQDDDGIGRCGVCGNELKCITHIDDDRNVICDICGEETSCKENPYDIFHEDYDNDHTCDYCGVWISTWCYDDDYDGYCDEYECGREFVCDHIDDDEDNYCDRCYRIINCTHDEVYDHYCFTCNQKVSDCHDDDGDMWCDECYMDMPCQHIGMEGEHICLVCYDYLSDCIDEDGDGVCDLSEYFPHPVQ